MDKFLFTDGISGVKEIHSRNELQKLIDATEQPDKIRIWIFNSHEWISYAAFCKLAPVFVKKQVPAAVETQPLQTLGARKTNKWLKKFLFLVFLVAGGFLIFNFTGISWEKGEAIFTSAARPENMPARDIDSLIWTIEELRGQKLDRSTRTNLRLRNTWPERILVQLSAAPETNKNKETRFSGIELMIDNTTGFAIDKMVLNVTSWKGQTRSISDTFHFNSIGYDGPVKRMLDTRYRGDSITVTVESIRAKSFNFCYSANNKNEDGHYDPWFCRDGE
jgi:hypothetical protein